MQECEDPTNPASKALGPLLAEPITEQDHLLGPADAPITLIEYGDYECPHLALVQTEEVHDAINLVAVWLHAQHRVSPSTDVLDSRMHLSRGLFHRTAASS